MMRPAILIFAAIIALSQPAMAGVPLFGHVSCTLVRFYVAKYSESAAEKWARSHGASEAEIETARHCLHHGADVQTASATPKQPAAHPVTEPDSVQLKPDERGPDQEALRAPEGQPAEPEPISHADEPAAQVVAGPKDSEDRPTVNVSYQVRNDPIPGGKTSTSHAGNPGTVHRAYSPGATRQVTWFKRLWNHLTRPRQFAAAFFRPIR